MCYPGYIPLADSGVVAWPSTQVFLNRFATQGHSSERLLREVRLLILERVNRTRAKVTNKRFFLMPFNWERGEEKYF